MSSPPSPDALTALTTGSHTVLVATGDAALGRMVAMALQLQGYSCRLSSDGQQALEALLAEPVAAAVLDSHLPIVDGFTVCERLRFSASKASSIPVILLLLQEDTALWQRESERLQPSVALFIPFQLTNLLAAVAAAIGEK